MEIREAINRAFRFSRNFFRIEEDVSSDDNGLEYQYVCRQCCHSVLGLFAFILLCVCH